MDDHLTHSQMMEMRADLWRQWRTRDGSHVITSHDAPVNAVAVGLLNGHTVIASGGDDGIILLHDLRTGRAIGKPMVGTNGSVLQLVWVPVKGAAEALISLGSDSRLRRWNPSTAKEIARPTAQPGAVLLAAETQAERQVLATGSSDGIVRLRNARDGSKIVTLWAGSDGRQKVHVVSIDSPTRTEIFGNPTVKDRERILLDREAEERVKRLTLGDSRVTALDLGVHNGEQVLATANGLGELHVWRLNSELQFKQFNLAFQIKALRLLPYGSQLVAACATPGGQLQFIELATGMAVGGTEGHLMHPRAGITSIAYSTMNDFEMIAGDFPILAVGRDDASIDVWATNGSEIGRPWSGHAGKVTALCVAGHSGWPVVVTCSRDSTVRLWDLAAFAREPTDTTDRAVFANRLEELRLADLQRNFRPTSNLASHVGVTTSTIWSWVHGRSLPKDVALVEKLEAVFFGASDFLRRGELVYLYEKAMREKNVTSQARRASAGSAPRQIREPISDKDYDIFVSYSHKDRKLVEGFAESLQVHGVRLWYDKWEMRPGDILRERIQDGISNAKNFLVLVSRASLSSNWVKYELNSGMIQEIERGAVNVIPAFGPGVRPEDLPTDLRAKLAVDLRTPQGRQSAVDQLVALVQPEKRIRKEVLANLKEPANSAAEVQEKQRYANPWSMDKAQATAALRGLAKTDGPEALLAISRIVIGNSYNMALIALAIKCLAKRDSDGGLLVLSASLLQDGRFYFEKVSAIDRYLDGGKLIGSDLAPEPDANWSADRVAVDLERFSSSAVPDLLHGVVLAQLAPAPSWAGLQRALPDTAISAAIEYADSRIPGLSSLAAGVRSTPGDLIEYRAPLPD